MASEAFGMKVIGFRKIDELHEESSEHPLGTFRFLPIKTQFCLSTWLSAIVSNETSRGKELNQALASFSCLRQDSNIFICRPSSLVSSLLLEHESSHCCFPCLVAQSCPTLCTPWSEDQASLSSGFPGKNITGMVCPYLSPDISRLRDRTHNSWISGK